MTQPATESVRQDAHMDSEAELGVASLGGHLERLPENLDLIVRASITRPTTGEVAGFDGQRPLGESNRDIWRDGRRT
jgi:hypothetical protein